MSFSDVMFRVLLPVNGKQPHITSRYGEQRASDAHGGTDFNYIGGQGGVDLQYPTVVWLGVSPGPTFTCAMKASIPRANWPPQSRLFSATQHSSLPVRLKRIGEDILRKIQHARVQ